MWNFSDSSYIFFKDTFCCQGHSIGCKQNTHVNDISQNVPLDETLCEEYVRAPASLADSSCSTSDEFMGLIKGHTSTNVNEMIDSPVATPSLAASSISNILSLIDEQCHNGQVWTDMSNNDLACTSKYSEVQTQMQNTDKNNSTCVTLQTVDMKKKCPVQQTFAARTRFKTAERKGPYTLTPKVSDFIFLIKTIGIYAHVFFFCK